MKRFRTWTIVITMLVITAIALSNLPKKLEERNHVKQFQEQLAKEVDPWKAKEMIESEIEKGSLSEFGGTELRIETDPTSQFGQSLFVYLPELKTDEDIPSKIREKRFAERKHEFMEQVALLLDNPSIVYHFKTK
ncbi:hypothetical protein [Ammoniphilus sp. 3BR4]|uniref:hypothetical protein n=1 Tax=Ammoniphilus sp. 3BR4 TaxID=3158265 RepID=UPI0034650C5A